MNAGGVSFAILICHSVIGGRGAHNATTQASIEKSGLTMVRPE